MTRRPKRLSPMTGREFQEHRLRLGLSVETLAELLDASAVSIRNIESKQRPGRPLVRLLKLFQDPYVRHLAAEIADAERRSMVSQLE